MPKKQRPIPKVERTQWWAVIVNGSRRIDLGLYRQAIDALKVGVTWAEDGKKIEAEPIWVTVRHPDRLPYVPGLFDSDGGN